AQGALQEVGQVGARLGVAGVAGGCHRQGEVDRVRHGGVLSFGELHSPLVEGKTPPFTSLPPPGLMRYPRQAARQNSAFLAHWRDRTLSGTVTRLASSDPCGVRYPSCERRAGFVSLFSESSAR